MRPFAEQQGPNLAGPPGWLLLFPTPLPSCLHSAQLTLALVGDNHPPPPPVVSFSSTSFMCLLHTVCGCLLTPGHVLVALGRDQENTGSL